MSYRSHPALNQSALKMLKISEKHFIHALQNKTTQSVSQKIGTIAHSIVLEPDKKIVIFQGTRRGKEWENFQQENSDSLICIQSEYDKSAKIGIALKEFEPLKKLLEHKDTMCEIEEYFETNGIQCKRLVDLVNHTLKIKADLKTAKCIEINQFQSASFKYGYHNQADFYTRGNDGYRFLIFAVENSEPFDVDVFELDDELIEFAKQENDELLESAKIAMNKKETDMQGLYIGAPKSLTLPKWKLFELQSESEEFDIESELI